MKRFNPLLLVDHYKTTHAPQYPNGTEYVYSYVESRGGDFDETVFFGLQYWIKEYLMQPFCLDDILEARDLFSTYGGYFNYDGFIDLLHDHGGKWPIQIFAVDEGSIIPVKNCLLTIRNTDPKYPWVVSWLETSILRAIWYGTTVATLSYNCRKIIKGYLEKTGTVETLESRLTDFGARGVSSHESAMIGGAAHLISFNGSDTVEAIPFIREYYGTGDKNYLPSWAPRAASEHSSITSWGRNGELDAYKNLINKFLKPGTVVACVSDSYNIFNACKMYGTELRDNIVNSGGVFVVRPDSGIPHEIVLQVIQELEKYFGTSVNSKGFKVLPDYIRVIQGDGIDINSLETILYTLMKNGYSADNVYFGMGGGLLQKVDRDTQKWALKCSAIYVDNEWRDVFKDPITDTGKSSKTGILTLIKHDDGTYETCDVRKINIDTIKCQEKLVYSPTLGLQNEQSFEDIRKLVRA